MKPCRKIKKMLVAFASDELTHAESEFIRNHLDSCPGCRDEYDSLRLIIEDIEYLGQQNEDIVQVIDWKENEIRLNDKFRLMRTGLSTRRFRGLPGWKVLVPVLASVFIFGILAGYFLFRSAGSNFPGPLEIEPNRLSFERIETTLAKRQIQEYFTQVQFLLMDVVKQCENDSPPDLTGKLDSNQVRRLLLKNRYLSQNLNEPQLMSTKNMLEKIEMLLYELLVMTDQNPCRDIRRLQRMIQRERMFLKIRLVEKDLFSQEV